MASQPLYDVFLCHNSKEKQEVEEIREQLKQQGIYAWLDKYDFEPFRPWQDQLEEIIPQIKAAAVFMGLSGVGPWANIEMRAFLEEFAQHKIRMGLVILPGCPQEVINTVPRFLKSFHWVDFRISNPNPMEQLIWGITGVKPNLNLILKDNPIKDILVETSSTSKLSKPDEIELKSKRGIDYTELRDLLAAGEWKEADKETARVMLQAANRVKDGWLRVEDIDNFPCEDLRTINQLWLHYSKGKFGFSVQKEIYQNLGSNSIRNREVWEKFGDTVGWRVKKDWIYYSDITFDLSAPRGHLPITFNLHSTQIGGFFFFRVETCEV